MGKETSGPPDSGGEQEKEVPLELPNCLKLVHLLNDITWFPKCNISQVILSFYQFRVFSTALQRKKKIISIKHVLLAGNFSPLDPHLGDGLSHILAG